MISLKRCLGYRHSGMPRDRFVKGCEMCWLCWPWLAFRSDKGFEEQATSPTIPTRRFRGLLGIQLRPCPPAGRGSLLVRLSCIRSPLQSQSLSIFEKRLCFSAIRLPHDFLSPHVQEIIPEILKCASCFCLCHLGSSARSATMQVTS